MPSKKRTTRKRLKGRYVNGKELASINEKLARLKQLEKLAGDIDVHRELLEIKALIRSGGQSQVPERVQGVPLVQHKDYSELRAAVQGNVREYPAQEVMAFAYSLPDVYRAQNPYGGQVFQVSDGLFYLTDEDMFHRILVETEVDSVTWIAEKSDCNWIATYMSALVAVRLNTNSVGVVKSIFKDADGNDQGHAFNFQMIWTPRGLKMVFFEPQTDEVLTDKLGKQPYTLGPGRTSFYM